MHNRPKLSDVFVLTAVWYVAFAGPALAYFDLSVGTYLLQLLGGLGVAFYLTFKNNVMRRFAKPQPTPSKAIPESDDAIEDDSD